MPNARDLAAELLLAFDRQPGFVRDDLEARRRELADRRDRALLTEIVYGTIRHTGTLDAVLSRFSRRPLPTLNGAVRTALRQALHQVLFLDRVPAHAAVDHAVEWTRARAGASRAGFVNGVLRGTLRALEGEASGPDDPRCDVPRADGSRARFGRVVFSDPGPRLTRNLSERWSAPEWLVVRWIGAFGERRTREILQAGIMRPGLGVRARRDRDALLGSLRARGIEAVKSDVSTALLLSGGDADVLADVDAGEASIQDATSQRVAPLLEPQPGMRVLDLCAAPGGKTLHIADLLGTGEVVACDVESPKVEALAAIGPWPAGVRLETCLVPPSGPLPFDPGSFDAVLVDAPCTNTGVLRRRVEARWRLRPKHVASLATLQLDLLRRALPLLHPGGTLVYSTCSLEAEENEGVLAALRAAHPEIGIEVAFRAFPGTDGDGGFAATLSRSS